MVRRRRKRGRRKPLTGAAPITRSAYRRTTEERNAHELEAEEVRRRELYNGALPGAPIEIEEATGDVVDEDAKAEEERAEGAESEQTE